jgi:hypothetical protein
LATAAAKQAGTPLFEVLYAQCIPQSPFYAAGLAVYITLGAELDTSYTFESSDSLAQFTIWIIPVGGGGVVGMLFFAVGGWTSLFAGLIVGAVLIIGLRASISVTDTEAVIVKKWFFIPYRTYRAAEIEDVWFGGDWGFEEGAMGLVVKLAGKEIHVGTGKNMHELHDALWPLCAEYKAANKRMEGERASGENHAT